MCLCLQFSNVSILSTDAWLNATKIVKEQTEPHWFWYMTFVEATYVYVYAWWLYFSPAYKITFLLNLMCFCFFGLTQPFVDLKNIFCVCMLPMSYIVYAIEWLSYHWVPILKNELYLKKKNKRKYSKILRCTVASCEFSVFKTIVPTYSKP